MGRGSSSRGVWLGGLVGAFLRGGATFLNIGFDWGLFALVFAVPSFGIGALAGAVGGGQRSPGRGALVGALISAGLFVLLLVPVAWVFSLFGAADKVGAFTWRFFLQKAVIGAFAGALGSFVGGRSRAVAATQP